jgi:hypothetical protein
VSRLLARTLAQLRVGLLEEETGDVTTPPGDAGG